MDLENKKVYPTLWKKELITPVPKVTHPKQLKDLRKIFSTSDFSKEFEGFLRDWLMEDILDNIDPGQYGGLKGSGSEHMLIVLWTVSFNFWMFILFSQL